MTCDGTRCGLAHASVDTQGRVLEVSCLCTVEGEEIAAQDQKSREWSMKMVGDPYTIPPGSGAW